MNLNNRIETFSSLGGILRAAVDAIDTPFTSGLENLINTQQYVNPWFTPENVRSAVRAIANELTYENLTEWTGRYPELGSWKNISSVGVVMAGNIPLAGFHDFLSVLITGNNIIAKTSSKDPDLIGFIADILTEVDPSLKGSISFSDGPLKGFDSVIATGSDNSSRYFEYYFGRYPHIIRKNRNSVAVIDGSESENDIAGLGNDVFSYFGLGCRNVSKIFLPKGYDIRDITKKWHGFEHIINHNKYANNYDYNKAVYIVSRESFTDTGYLLLKESRHLSSPVAVLHYEYYSSLSDVLKEIEAMSEKIQCVISRDRVKFGSAQSPYLWDYADGVDTIEFLLKKN